MGDIVVCDKITMSVCSQDSQWQPGKEENCDMEDMERVDENVTPLEVAQQLAGKSEMVKLEAFFGGLKVGGAALRSLLMLLFDTIDFHDDCDVGVDDGGMIVMLAWMLVG